MSLVPKNLNQKVTREIVAILIIKVIILMVIKNIWFDAPLFLKILTIKLLSVLQAIHPQSRRHVDDI